MNILYAIHGLIYLSLLFLGVYFLGLDAQLTEEFFRVGWENYDGKPLDYYENTYYLIWILVSMGSLAFMKLKTKITGTTLAKENEIINGLSGACLMGYTLLYFSDGSVSLEESKIGWLFCSLGQIFLSIVFSSSTLLAKVVDMRLKQLFLLNALVYVGLFFIGCYFLYMDQTILANIAEVGLDQYVGIDKDYPENTYHFLLIIVLAISIFMAIRTKETSFGLSMHKWILLIFLLYAIFVYVNDGNPNMAGTLVWWGALCTSTSVSSGWLFFTTKDQLPEKEAYHNDNILDDLSNWD